MGILNRTPDSFYDAGLTYEFDALLRRAEVLVDEGADLLDVGGVKAGPGPEVGEEEELDRVVGADRSAAPALRHADLVRHLAGRACSTPRARSARSSATTSAGSAIPTTSASRPSTARRWSPPTSVCSRASPTPSRTTTISSATSPPSCSIAPRRRRPPASQPDQIALDAGLDLGKTPAQSMVLLRESDPLAAHGYALLLSASNKRYLGELLGLAIDERRAVSLASVAYGVAHGCRIVRVHDVKGSVQIVPHGRGDPRARAEARGAGSA